jgi:predicted RNase H-like HicB family nuclease
MTYPVALTRTEEGYSVSCPGLPGGWSQGATEEEARANTRAAIHDYLEVAKELASGVARAGDTRKPQIRAVKALE